MTEILNKKVEALTFWQQPILCEPVKGGITNLNFRVEHGNEMFLCVWEKIFRSMAYIVLMNWPQVELLLPAEFLRKLFMQNPEQWFCVLSKVKLWSRKICGIFLTWKKSFLY